MKYEEPIIEVVLFSTRDVVTASQTPGLQNTGNNVNDSSGWGSFGSWGSSGWF